MAPPAREADKRHIQMLWGTSVPWYLLAIGATTLLPVPALGITDAVRRAQDLPGTGLRIDEPHRVVAAGFLYFAAVTATVARVQWKRVPDDAPEEAVTAPGW